MSTVVAIRTYPGGTRDYNARLTTVQDIVPRRSVMRAPWRFALTKRLQKRFWVYLTKNFVISSTNSLKGIDPKCPCLFIPITTDNCHRVQEFREHARIAEYREKLKGEIGFFAECNGKAIGSIWATVNHAPTPIIVRTYMQLMSNEALIHDIVTGEDYRGNNVGPFMVSRLASVLLSIEHVSRIIIDVNVRNGPSIRMMEKLGLHPHEQVIYLSLAGTLAFQKTLRHYPLSD